MKKNELVGSVQFQMPGGPVERFEFSFGYSGRSMNNSYLMQAARVKLSEMMNCHPGALILFPDSLRYSTI